MSLYTNAKEMITDIQKIMQDNNSLGKCIFIFQTISWLGSFAYSAVGVLWLARACDRAI